MYSLLGHDEGGEDPESMAMHELFRYIVTDGEEQFIGYLLPLSTGFEFITIGLDGSFVSRVPVQLSETQVLESGERDTANRSRARAHQNHPFCRSDTGGYR
ncbi:MAG: hypothetical protein JKP90_00130 [Desulfofustis sp. PB-SRB1]|nr:hypothetical protein [Desulfofustis sp. PB-SRB1]